MDMSGVCWNFNYVWQVVHVTSVRRYVAQRFIVIVFTVVIAVRVWLVLGDGGIKWIYFKDVCVLRDVGVFQFFQFDLDLDL